MKKLLYFISAVLLLSSCATQIQITKRNFRKGYYVSLSKNNKEQTPEEKQPLSVTNSFKNKGKESIIQTKVEKIDFSKSSLPKTKSSKPIIYRNKKGKIQQQNVALSKPQPTKVKQKNSPRPKTIPPSDDNESDIDRKLALIFSIIGVGTLALSQIIYAIEMQLGTGYGIIGIALLSIIGLIASFIAKAKNKKYDRTIVKIFSTIGIIAHLIILGIFTILLILGLLIVYLLLTPQN